MIDIFIDGKKCSAEPGTTIIQVADAAGVYIPRFCYHKKLSVAANCRMCLVEVEKAPKTLPACATPIAPDMKVFTRSEKALSSQRTVMEFLLINHPLDCPICDQGGECELQDLSMAYGKGISRFTEGKRAVHDEDLGPLVATEMTRCIQCTRCVRFGEEVAGLPELTRIGRGEDLEISTYVGHMMESELSGNVIDLCPVGALTSKPYRFTARAWEMVQRAAIAPHDCVGSNIYIHTRSQRGYTPKHQVMRVVPRDNEELNETWISNRDRYSYEAVNSEQRILTPLVKYDGHWVDVTWDVALVEVVKRLQEVDPEQLAALTSPSATLEEMYLLQKLVRGLGSQHIDHRFRHTDFRDQASAPFYPTLGMRIAELDTLDALLLIGSNVRYEQPILAQRIRKAVKKGAAVMCVNPVNYTFNFATYKTCTVGGDAFVLTLAKILKALYSGGSDSTLSAKLRALIAPITPDETAIAIAQKLMASKRAAVFIGAYGDHHPQAAVIRALAQQIAKKANATMGNLSEGANSAGAWLAGAVPHRAAGGKPIENPGLNACDMFAMPRRAYVLLGVEPELDSAYAATALAALRRADSVIMLSAFRGGAMEEYAHVILPIASFAETAGSYMNAHGEVQSQQAATLPLGDAQPAWAVLNNLAQQLSLPDFNYAAAEKIRDELLKLPAEHHPQHSDLPEAPTSSANSLQRVVEWPMYCVDSLVRHAPALQASMASDVASIRINSALAHRLHLQAGMLVTATQDESHVTLPLVVDERIADNQVVIPAGLQATAGFGEVRGEIVLTEKKKQKT